MRLLQEQGKLLLRQGLVGLACFCLNLLLMWYLVAIARIHVLAATAICFFVLNAVGHHLSRILVFVAPRPGYKKSLLRFMLVMAASLTLNLAAMALATQWLGLPYLLASTAIAALFFVGNYIAHRDWTFR